MALLIKDPETDRIVRELAERTGESLTEAVKVAAKQRLEAFREPGVTVVKPVRSVGPEVAEAAHADCSRRWQLDRRLVL